MGNFFDKPSPYYHYVIMLPIYYTFSFLLDEFVMRRRASIGLIIAALSTILVMVNYVIGAYPSGNVGLFYVVKSYSVIIPTIWTTAYRIWGRRNVDDNINCNYNYQQDTNGICIDIDVDVDDNDNDQAKDWRKIWTKMGCNCLNKRCIKLCSNTKCAKMTRIFSYLFLSINICEALLVESIPGSTESNDGVWEWAKYINIIAGMICVMTIPLPKVTSWYLNKNRDYIMYLANDKKYYYCGVLWIILYSLWNFEFSIRFVGSQTVLFIPIHLIIPFCKAIYKNEFGLWIQSRLYVLWIYIVFIFIFRAKIFNTSNIDENFMSNGVTLGIFAIGAFITSILYSIIYYSCNLKSKSKSKSEHTASLPTEAVVAGMQDGKHGASTQLQLQLQAPLSTQDSVAGNVSVELVALTREEDKNDPNTIPFTVGSVDINTRGCAHPTIANNPQSHMHIGDGAPQKSTGL